MANHFVGLWILRVGKPDSICQEDAGLVHTEACRYLSCVPWSVMPWFCGFRLDNCFLCETRQNNVFIRLGYIYIYVYIYMEYWQQKIPQYIVMYKPVMLAVASLLWTLIVKEERKEQSWKVIADNNSEQQQQCGPSDVWTRRRAIFFFFTDWRDHSLTATSAPPPSPSTHFLLCLTHTGSFWVRC